MTWFRGNLRVRGRASGYSRASPCRSSVLRHATMCPLALTRGDRGDLTSELEAALSAARRAGEVLRAAFGTDHAITYKGEVDLLTEVDEEAERVIREELLGTFPTYGMLAEEGG